MKKDFFVGQIIPFGLRLFRIRSIKIDRAPNPREVQIKLVRLGE